MLYRMVAGELPFGSGLQAVLKIVTGSLPPKPWPLDAYPQFAPLTDELWTIIQGCFERDPASRPDADALVSVCSELCYSQSQRALGTIAQFGGSRGSFGFIDGDDGGRVFFHSGGYYGRKPEPGVRVNFASFPGRPYPRAFPVLPLANPST